MRRGSGWEKSEPASASLTNLPFGIVVRQPVFLTPFDPASLNPSPSQYIGEVVLGFSNSDLNLKLASIRSMVNLSIAFFVVMFALLMVFLERWVSRPIIDLTEKIRGIAEGNLSIRVNVPKVADEMAILCHSINLMADSIEQHTTGLEQRLKERTAELEISNKELEAFSYCVSHDLRAPLRGIDGWSLALLEDYHDQLDERGRKYLDRVRSETQHMGKLIDELLLLSHVARSNIQRETVDLSALAQTIADRLHEANPDRTLEFCIEPGLKAIGGIKLLEVVLTNLFDNACKFTGSKTQARIEFGSNKEKGQTVFFIRDNGVGFDLAYADKLFGAFQRLHKTSEFPGIGIGLATVQRIIHRHGGLVWADAEVGQGATFYFSLAVPSPL